MNELQKYDPESGGALAIREETPMGLMRMAIEGKCDVGTIERLSVLQEKYEAKKAKQAFDEDMAAFQSECPTILKTTWGAQNKYKYAPLDHIVSQVKPLLVAHGFSHRETSPESKPGFVRAVVIVTHRAGHTQESGFEVPVDTKTTKDGFAIMSAPQTYSGALTLATRRAFCLAFGILTADEDKDGSQTAQIKTGLKAMRGLPELKPTQVPLAPAPVQDREQAKAILWAALKPKGFTSWPEAWQWCVDECDPTLPTLKQATADQLLALAEQARGKLK